MLDGQWTFIWSRGGFGDDEKGRRQTFPCVKRIPKPISCWPLCSQRRILPSPGGANLQIKAFQGGRCVKQSFQGGRFCRALFHFWGYFSVQAAYWEVHLSIHPYISPFFNLKMMQRQRDKTLVNCPLATAHNFNLPKKVLICNSNLHF